MNRKPPSRFEPSSSGVRLLCAAAAIAAAVASLGFVDALAYRYSAPATSMAQGVPAPVSEG